LSYFINMNLARITALTMLIINFTYIQCYTLYPTNSIEGYIAWLLFPVLFIVIRLSDFYYILHALRYFFLFFFASAGIWKFVQGGIFNVDQMSGILLYQHKEYLISSPDNWYSSFIYWLVKHSTISFLLYAGATVLELSFFIGFFTIKKDHLLAAAFILFLMLDVLFMRISYFEITPFLLTLLYSKYTPPITSGDYKMRQTSFR
ncbi:MAG TPA: hypothetical protein VF623_12415, partial [Segetibacter sp.]